MIVTRLKLSNLRAIEAAEFSFQQGFNLIVGINGVGKTSVLDALAVCLSGVVKHTNRLRMRTESFLNKDIRLGAQALTALCRVQMGEAIHEYLVVESRESSEAQAKKAGMPREQVIDTPDKAHFIGDPPTRAATRQDGGRPIGILFSTRRAAPSDRTRSKGAAAGAIAVAFADALTDRDLRLAEFAAWMRAQQSLRAERGEQAHALNAFERAVNRFLPGYRNIRPTDENPPRLFIDHGHKMTINVDELSDTEKSQLKEALAWAENWMVLNWEPPTNIGEKQLAEAYAEKRAAILADGLTRFLPNCDNLRPNPSQPDSQVIDRKPTTIEVRALSDGERGVLAMVLDITRRLAHANPTMVDPAAEAEAVILIDEIDLHLHPKWQRQIVNNLTTVFPKCQFIATTHSPQVVAAVEPESVHIMTHDGVQKIDRSRGMDSNWILRNLMETQDRPSESLGAIQAVEALINQGDFEQARERIAREREAGLDLPEWSVFEARIARMEMLGE